MEGGAQDLGRDLLCLERPFPEKKKKEQNTVSCVVLIERPISIPSIRIRHQPAHSGPTTHTHTHNYPHIAYMAEEIKPSSRSHKSRSRGSSKLAFLKLSVDSFAFPPCSVHGQTKALASPSHSYLPLRCCLCAEGHFRWGFDFCLCFTCEIVWRTVPGLESP